MSRASRIIERDGRFYVGSKWFSTYAKAYAHTWSPSQRSNPEPATQNIRERYQSVLRLLAGATTPGERTAADAARARMEARYSGLGAQQATGGYGRAHDAYNAYKEAERTAARDAEARRAREADERMRQAVRDAEQRAREAEQRDRERQAAAAEAEQRARARASPGVEYKYAEYKDGKSNKFWEYRAWGEADDYATVRWGRIGAKGQTQDVTLVEARIRWREKLAKGYKP